MNTDLSMPMYGNASNVPSLPIFSTMNLEDSAKDLRFPLINAVYNESKFIKAEKQLVNHPESVNYIIVSKSPESKELDSKVSYITADYIKNTGDLEGVLKLIQDCSVIYLLIHGTTFFSNKQAESLGEALKNPNQKLMDLKLIECNIKLKGFEKICKGLAANKSIITLEISKNTSLGNHLITKLVPALKENKDL